ncbi:MAG: gliding motility protein GldM [Cyclobacteriaceae bacterium]|nr:gliding motility protein GldM [Cyclobacteriaceae bacterium]
MAGGKETPRQKMIGMMYLVLTALLALNVSSAVLEKFSILNTTLLELRDDENNVNESKLKAVLGATSSAEHVLKAKEQAQKVRDLTKETLAKMDVLKEEISKGHDGKKMEGEELVLNTNIAEEKLLDPRNPKLGKDYETVLDDYVKKLVELTDNKLKPARLTKTAADYEEFKNNKTHKDKGFLEFSFEGTPTIAAITSITQMQSEILEHEAAALDTLNAIAEGALIKFDKVVPMVIGPSVVAAGAKYEGRLFMAGASSGVTPEMFRNGSPLIVSLDNETGIKMAKVEFTATAPSFDPNGLSKQTFEAEIRPGAGKEPIKRRIDYTVVQPTIKVTTGNAPTLYMNCGNLVNIEVPTLGSNYNPSFNAKGAEVIGGDKPGRVTIIPTDRKVTVGVLNGGVLIGNQPFDVKPIPKPHIVARENSGKEVDLKNGVRGAATTGLRVSAEPEENFKTEVPKDAQYRIRSMQVILARGTSQVATINATSESLDLNAWRSQFRPGDRIVLDIKTVTRRTFKGEDEKVDIGPSVVINIPVQ